MKKNKLPPAHYGVIKRPDVTIVNHTFMSGHTVDLHLACTLPFFRVACRRFGEYHWLLRSVLSEYSEKLASISDFPLLERSWKYLIFPHCSRITVILGFENFKRGVLGKPK